jgi:hypothetical protein
MLRYYLSQVTVIILQLVLDKIKNIADTVTVFLNLLHIVLSVHIFTSIQAGIQSVQEVSKI